MADLSLGPLRIANPDDTSPDTSGQQHQHMAHSLPVVSPLSNMNGHQDYLSMPRQRSHSPVSPLVTSPVEPSSAPSRSVPALQSYQQRSSQQPRQKNSLPLTYQDQQQSQFPKYPTMMPQNLIDNRSNPNTSRPTSTYYTQLPVNGSSAANVSRQSSYRMRGDPSAGIPSRTGSKRAALGTQARRPIAR